MNPAWRPVGPGFGFRFATDAGRRAIAAQAIVAADEWNRLVHGA